MVNIKGFKGKEDLQFEELLEQKPEIVLDQLLTFIEEQNNFSREQVHDIYQKQLDAFVPLSIFAGKLTTLEALVCFLKDQRRFPTNKVSRLLKRSSACVSITYKRAKNKSYMIKAKAYDTKVPLIIFRSSRFSAQEALVRHLQNSGMPSRHISKCLGLDPRNTWTILKRIRNKERGEGK